MRQRVESGRAEHYREQGKREVRRLERPVPHQSPYR